MASLVLRTHTASQRLNAHGATSLNTQLFRLMYQHTPVSPAPLPQPTAVGAPTAMTPTQWALLPRGPAGSLPPTCVSPMSPRTAPSLPVDPFLSSSDTRAPGSPLLACPCSTGKVQAVSGYFRGHGQAMSSLTALLCSSGFQFHLHAPHPRSTYPRLCMAFPKVLHRGPP